jgi:hypothetical protein
MSGAKSFMIQNRNDNNLGAVTMHKSDRIYVAGHRGMVGSAIVRALNREGFHNLVMATRQELDLKKNSDFASFFKSEKPDYIFLAAAKVGGIQTNMRYPDEYVRKKYSLPGTELIHKCGFYCGNYPELTETDLETISS